LKELRALNRLILIILNSKDKNSQTIRMKNWMHLWMKSRK